MPAASAVAADDEIAASEVVDCVVSMVRESVEAGDAGGTMVRYRLLETTRAYALEKLAQSGELEAVARRHAEHYRDFFERAETEWDTRPTAEWLADYGRQIDDLRAALDWAFSQRGKASVAVALTVAAVPLWFLLSLVDESLVRVVRASAVLNMERRWGENLRRQLYATLCRFTW